MRRIPRKRNPDLGVGRLACFVVRRGPEPDSEIAWVIDQGEIQPAGGGRGPTER